MNLVYAKKTDERVIEFHINDTIGEKIKGSYIESDMSFINLNKMADRINFRINSEGGSVLEGFKIISSILNSKIPVYTYNDGFAMSMGFYIWISAKKENRKMASFATNMIHAARFVDENGQMIEPDNSDDTIYLNVLNKMLLDITEQSSGITKDEVIQLMSRDTFLNSEETLKLGLIESNNIIQFKDMPQFAFEASITDKMKTIAAFYKDNNNSKIKTMTEFKNVAAKLNLQAEASESSIVSAIDNIMSAKTKAEKELKDALANLDKKENEIETKSTEISKLKTTVANFEEKEKELKKTMVKAEVAKAIEAGKFDKSDSEELEAMAIKNPEMFTKLVAKAKVNVTVEGANIAAQLEGDNLTEIAAKFGVKAENLNFGYLWQNEPTVLARMEKEIPKFVDKLKENWEE